jgi:hypothetical protein
LSGEQLAAVISYQISSQPPDSSWGFAGSLAFIISGAPGAHTICPIYCGGINSQKPFSTTVQAEVFGFEQPPNEPDKQTPIKAQFFFTLMSPF